MNKQANDRYRHPRRAVDASGYLYLVFDNGFYRGAVVFDSCDVDPGDSGWTLYAGASIDYGVTWNDFDLIMSISLLFFTCSADRP